MLLMATVFRNGAQYLAEGTFSNDFDRFEGITSELYSSYADVLRLYFIQFFPPLLFGLLADLHLIQLVLELFAPNLH